MPSGMLGFSRANLLCSTSIEQVPPVTTPAQPFCILSPNIFALQVSSECAPGSLLPAALGRFHCRHIALRALPCGCRIPAPVASHSCGSRELPAAAGVGGSALSTACGCRGRWQGLGRHRAEGRSAWSTGHAVRAASTTPHALRAAESVQGHLAAWLHPAKKRGENKGSGSEVPKRTEGCLPSSRVGSGRACGPALQPAAMGTDRRGARLRCC